MILYYALGGGLGHIARSFALISHAPEALRSNMRLLVSSNSFFAAASHSPCGVDEVPRWAMTDNGRYAQFLSRYFERYGFSRIVIDTFPFGLLGELRHVARELPRVLVGRYLRWDAYATRCGDTDDAPWPQAAVMIEEQQELYLAQMNRNCPVITARWPVSLAKPADIAGPPEEEACCVVHSGPRSETAQLVAAARRIMAERGMAGAPEVFTPGRGLFPLERHLTRFSDVVTGAGYGSCAAAAILKGRVRYHLHPFPRRFDDQALRLRRLERGLWGNNPGGDASTTAGMLWDSVSSLSKRTS